MSLCRYSDALGKPGRGAHSFRAGPFAAADLLLTVALAFALNTWLSRRSEGARWWRGFLFLFFTSWMLGTVLHAVFCVDTPVTRYFFPRGR